jgi:hypothetical protein
MYKIKFLLLIGVLCLFSNLKAQEFYETSWKSDNITYTGLLIFYNNDDAVMRVRYTANNVYKVAEFKCQYTKLQIAGYEGYILDGMSAKLVYGNKDNKTPGYNADNFVFYKGSSGYDLPFTIDDDQITKSNPLQYLKKVETWKKIPTTTFTEKYVHNFYEKDEPLYTKLIAYNQRGVEGSGGYRVSSTASSSSEWFVCMSKGLDITSQTTYNEALFPADWIKSKWDEGKEITNISYGNGKWLVVMSANSKITTQSYSSKSFSFPSSWIDDKVKTGYYISGLTYSNEGWLAVMSKGLSYTDQRYYNSSTFPAEWVKSRWSEGYRITSAAYGGNQWAVVMSKNSGITEQSYNQLATPNEWIKKKWEDGFEINNLAYANGEWLVVMSQNTGISLQTWNISAVYPRDWVQEKWDSKTTPSNPTSSNNVYTSVSPNNNTKMHLFIVANTIISDIGTSCKVDEDRTANEFEDFAKVLNIKIVKHIIDGNNFSKSSVNRELDYFYPSSNDIVVFVYTGHGFRWTNQTSRYPSISLKYSSYENLSETNSYLLSDIYDKITRKGARLNIVVGDCCNSSVGVSSRGGDAGLASRFATDGNVSKLEQLFMKTKGNLLIAAASPYETSCGSSRDGGYLISSFFQAINKETSYLNNANPTWDHIVQNAINSARYNTQNLNGCKTQNGIYQSTIN